MPKSLQEGQGDIKIKPEIRLLSEQYADEGIAQGAQAALLLGSYVRGDFYPESDVDITLVGEGLSYRLERSGDRLVSISWRSAENIRQSMQNPAEVGGLIPAIRGSYILMDPMGVAGELKKEANDWSWDPIGDQCNAWVAEEITGFSEEVHRLVGNLRLGRFGIAAVVRNVLSIRLATILAVHHRILYETENRLWDLVNLEMGDAWTRVQQSAFGMGQESFQDTCRSALELYYLAANDVKSLLNERQSGVVRHACLIAGFPNL